MSSISVTRTPSLVMNAGVIIPYHRRYHYRMNIYDMHIEVKPFHFIFHLKAHNASV